MSDPTARPSSAAPAAASGPRWRLELEVTGDHAAASDAPGSAGSAGSARAPRSAAIDGLQPGVRVARDKHGAPVATVLGGNPLAEAWTPPATWEGDLVIWSGSLAEDLREVHPHTWMGPGRERLGARVAELLPRVREQGGRLLLRAHARQVLSDPPSVRAFLAEQSAEPVGFVLEPAALFESSMLGEEAEDHLERILGGLGDLASVLLLSDVRAAAEDGCPALVAPGTGELPAAAFDQAIDRWIDAACPRLLRADQVQVS